MKASRSQKKKLIKFLKRKQKKGLELPSKTQQQQQQQGSCHMCAILNYVGSDCCSLTTFPLKFFRKRRRIRDISRRHSKKPKRTEKMCHTRHSGTSFRHACVRLRTIGPIHGDVLLNQSEQFKS